MNKNSRYYEPSLLESFYELFTYDLKVDNKRSASAKREEGQDEDDRDENRNAVTLH